MRKLIRRLKEGDEKPIDISFEDAKAYLRNHPFMQLDSQLDDEVWVQLSTLQQMVALVASTESICEGDWEGTGWYRTKQDRDGDDNWLRLVMGCPKSSRAAVARVAIAERKETDGPA